MVYCMCIDNDCTFVQVHNATHVVSTIQHKYSSCPDCPSWLGVLIRCDCQSVEGKILKKGDIFGWKKIAFKMSNIMEATMATIAREPLTYNTSSGAVRPASLNRETYASLMGVILAILETYVMLAILKPMQFGQY